MGGPSPAKKSGGGGGVAVVVVVIGMLVMAVPILGILAAIAIPNFVAMQYRAKRAEVPANVEGIKTAQMGYDAAFDAFVSTGDPHPRPVRALGKNATSWRGGNAGFQTLGWMPDGDVRGTYWVTTTYDGFEVHGMIDADGDGEPAHYVATRDENTRMVTSNDVY